MKNLSVLFARVQQSKVVKGVAVAAGVVAFGLGVVEPASAASVLDTAMQTALTAGLTDLKDTIKDVIATSWPYMLGATVLIMAPGLAQKFIKRTGS
jgi:hypothetical protein